MANSFEHISIIAVKVLARLAAKRAVEAELRSAGIRVTLVRPAVINERATAYLATHPELYTNARPVVERMIREGKFGKRAQRALSANITTAAQSNQPCSDTTISVRNSCTE